MHLSKTWLALIFFAVAACKPARAPVEESLVQAAGGGGGKCQKVKERMKELGVRLSVIRLLGSQQRGVAAAAAITALAREAGPNVSFEKFAGDLKLLDKGGSLNVEKSESFLRDIVEKGKVVVQESRPNGKQAFVLRPKNAVGRSVFSLATLEFALTDALNKEPAQSRRVLADRSLSEISEASRRSAVHGIVTPVAAKAYGMLLNALASAVPTGQSYLQASIAAQRISVGLITGGLPQISKSLRTIASSTPNLTPQEAEKLSVRLARVASVAPKNIAPAIESAADKVLQAKGLADGKGALIKTQEYAKSLSIALESAKGDHPRITELKTSLREKLALNVQKNPKLAKMADSIKQATNIEELRKTVQKIQANIRTVRSSAVRR